MLLDQVVKAVIADGGEAEKINGTGTYVYNYNFMLGFLAEDNYRYCDILLQPQHLAWIHLMSNKVISPTPPILCLQALVHLHVNLLQQQSEQSNLFLIYLDPLWHWSNLPLAQE